MRAHSALDKSTSLEDLCRLKSLRRRPGYKGRPSFPCTPNCGEILMKSVNPSGRIRNVGNERAKHDLTTGQKRKWCHDAENDEPGIDQYPLKTEVARKMARLNSGTKSSNRAKQREPSKNRESSVASCRLDTDGMEGSQRLLDCFPWCNPESIHCVPVRLEDSCQVRRTFQFAKTMPNFNIRYPNYVS